MTVLQPNEELSRQWRHFVDRRQFFFSYESVRESLQNQRARAVAKLAGEALPVRGRSHFQCCNGPNRAATSRRSLPRRDVA